MKTKLVAIGASLIIAIGFFPAQAVEGGVDAAGSQFVVPIKMQKSPTTTGACSGALIAPYIVVTAGHCVLDSSGLLTTKIYVGLAGSSMELITTSDIIDSVQITSSFQNGANSTVGQDDLAFLTLKKPQPMPTQVFLASESEMNALKSASAQLKLFGYGRYGDTSEETITFPKSYSGTFSQFTAPLPNSGYLESTLANACSGDSGGPILSITATQVTLVGITTGGTTGKYCTKPLVSNGKYYAMFTVIGRYSNLAFASANRTMTTLSESHEKTRVDLEAVESDLRSEIFDLQEENRRLVNLQATMDRYVKSLAALNAKIKKICSAKPKPKGC
jgi:secreted trypsin-like serine protease